MKDKVYVESFKDFAKQNPAELQIVENPNKNPTIMPKSKIDSDKALSEFQTQVMSAGLIVAGQTVGSTINNLAISRVLAGMPALVQQGARIAIPLVLGVTGTLWSRNKNVRSFALGLGTQGVIEAVQLALPDFTPDNPRFGTAGGNGMNAGANGSNTDEGMSDSQKLLDSIRNGDMAVTPSGNVVPAGAAVEFSELEEA